MLRLLINTEILSTILLYDAKAGPKFAEEAA